MKNKLISIITVVYNTQATLEATIKSVLSQEEDLFEYWIIDGGSTDRSVEIIRKYENNLAGWISEPDLGIYDAMNKGLKRANGEWIYFLGADDILQPNIFSQIQSELDSNYVAIYGAVLFENGAKMQSDLNLRILLQNTVHHQSVLYHKDLFTSFRYNIKLRAIADYELNLKLWLEKLPCKKLSIILALCDSRGTSSSFELSLNETNQVRHKYVKNKLIQKLLSIILWSYYAQKKFRGASMVG